MTRKIPTKESLDRRDRRLLHNIRVAAEDAIDKVCNDLEKAESTIRELVEALSALEPYFSQVEAHGGREAVKLADAVLAKANEGRGT